MSVKKILDKAITTADAQSSSDKSSIRKAIVLLKQATSIINNVGMDSRDKKLIRVADNIQNNISSLDDALNRL